MYINQKNKRQQTNWQSVLCNALPSDYRIVVCSFSHQQLFFIWPFNYRRTTTFTFRLTQKTCQFSTSHSHFYATVSEESLKQLSSKSSFKGQSIKNSFKVRHSYFYSKRSLRMEKKKKVTFWIKGAEIRRALRAIVITASLSARPRICHN